MGVTFCAVAAEHPLATHAAQRSPHVRAFIEEASAAASSRPTWRRWKRRACRPGSSSRHPLTGEKVEVWVGNYVLMSYGDGAVMGVPAHDERDFAFAQKYGLPIKPVIDVDGQDVRLRRAGSRGTTTRRAAACVNSGKYDGLGHEAAVDAIAADLAPTGLGEKRTTYRLRDWGISRQRYWGTPIPIVHCAECGDVPVPDDQLPVRAARGLRAGRQRQPARQARRLRRHDVPEVRRRGAARDRHDGHVRRLVVVLHALRVPRRARRWSTSATHYWMPMDQYIGGIEHAILHLLYARFWTKVMRDMGLVGYDEPFTNLLTQGMVLNHTYFRRTDKGGIDYFAPEDVDVERDADGRITGGRAKADGSARRVRRHRHDVEVEAQRRRSAGHDRPLRRRHRALLRDVRGAAGADARVVGRGRRRRAPLPAPAVDVRAGAIGERPRSRAAPPRRAPPQRCADRAPRDPPDARSRRTTTTSASSTTPWCRRA